MTSIVVTEDVGGVHTRLIERWACRYEPDAWRSETELRRVLADAEVAVVRNRTRVDRAFFEAAPRLAVVARAGVGLDNIDLDAADRAGVVVLAPLGANAVSVAEHALALALALVKRLLPADASTRAGEWDRTPTSELRGRTWGLLSAGATARETGRLARALGMDVVAFDPYLDPDDPRLLESGVRLAALDEVLRASDVLSIHLPSTETTRHLVDADALARLPAGAFLISVGRGEVLDEEALLAALDSGRLAGAGLDVREEEPPLPGRLERHPKVLLTPHIAGVTTEAQERIGTLLVEQLERLLDGHEAELAVGRIRAVRRSHA